MKVSESNSQVYDNPRIVAQPDTNAWQGKVVWSPVKSIWVMSMTSIGIIGAAYTFSLTNLLVFLITTGITLCLGHS